MKTAFITGITGQDGAYMAEYLIKKGYISDMNEKIFIDKVGEKYLENIKSKVEGMKVKGQRPVVAVDQAYFRPARWTCSLAIRPNRKPCWDGLRNMT